MHINNRLCYFIHESLVALRRKDIEITDKLKQIYKVYDQSASMERFDRIKDLQYPSYKQQFQGEAHFEDIGFGQYLLQRYATYARSRGNWIYFDNRYHASSYAFQQQVRENARVVINPHSASLTANIISFLLSVFRKNKGVISFKVNQILNDKKCDFVIIYCDNQAAATSILKQLLDQFAGSKPETAGPLPFFISEHSYMGWATNIPSLSLGNYVLSAVITSTLAIFKHFDHISRDISHQQISEIAICMNEYWGINLIHPHIINTGWQEQKLCRIVQDINRPKAVASNPLICITQTAKEIWEKAQRRVLQLNAQSIQHSGRCQFCGTRTWKGCRHNCRCCARLACNKCLDTKQTFLAYDKKIGESKITKEYICGICSAFYSSTHEDISAIRNISSTISDYQIWKAED